MQTFMAARRKSQWQSKLYRQQAQTPHMQQAQSTGSLSPSLLWSTWQQAHHALMRCRPVMTAPQLAQSLIVELKKSCWHWQMLSPDWKWSWRMLERQ